jgi:hypothetical protein
MDSVLEMGHMALWSLVGAMMLWVAITVRRAGFESPYKYLPCSTGSRCVLTFERYRSRIPASDSSRGSTSSTGRLYPVRVSGIPRSWNRNVVQAALKACELAPKADDDSFSDSLHLFDACYGTGQVALCEVDSSAPIVQQISSRNGLYRRITLSGVERAQLKFDTRFYDMTPLNSPQGDVVAE